MKCCSERWRARRLFDERRRSGERRHESLTPPRILPLLTSSPHGRRCSCGLSKSTSTCPAPFRRFPSPPSAPRRAWRASRKRTRGCHRPRPQAVLTGRHFPLRLPAASVAWLPPSRTATASSGASACCALGEQALGLRGVAAAGCGNPLTAPLTLAGRQVRVSRGPAVLPRQRGDAVGRVQARAGAP